MSMNKIPPFPQAVLEGICRAIGDTNTGLTGTQIGAYLAQEHISDVDPLTPSRRMFSVAADL